MEMPSPVKFSAPMLALNEHYRYPNVWEIEQTTGPQRMVIAPDGSHVDLLAELTAHMSQRFWILYVLLDSRCGQEIGRYQCPEPLDRSEILRFLDSYRDYFENDGRHHVWIGDIDSDALLIYDKHDFIYAYGPIADFQKVLVRRRMTTGRIVIPSPHAHGFNPAFDQDEQRILKEYEWKYFPLQPSDYE